VGTLFLVATPIGNLEDITHRAIRILSHVRLIAAEDTRRTRQLLAHYHISTPLISYHEHNKLSRLEDVLGVLSQGDVALVSDAGTPGLNDPGYELVKTAVQSGFPISPIPGPCAPIAALIASGLPTDAFLYLGYLPRKSSERCQLLRRIRHLSFTMIFLETPHRLLAALNDLHCELGDRSMVIAREMTKLHEEIFRGRVSEALSNFSARQIRGEITLVIAGNITSEIWPEQQLLTTLQRSLANGKSPAKTASEISTQSGWARRTVYRLITQIQNSEIPQKSSIQSKRKIESKK
jgi:16S rRNA (cytidine1402-2'-O)-methyltransferase